MLWECCFVADFLINMEAISYTIWMMFLCLVLHYSYVVNLLLKCTWNWDLFVTWLTTLTRGLALLAFTSNWSSRNMTCYSLATIWKNGKNNLFRGHSCIHTFKLFHNAVSQFSYDISAALKVCLTSEKGWRWQECEGGEGERHTQKAILTFTLPASLARLPVCVL